MIDIGDFDDPEDGADPELDDLAETFFGSGATIGEVSPITLDSLSQFHTSLQSFVNQFTSQAGMPSIPLVPQLGLNNATAHCGVPFVPGDEVIYYDPDYFFRTMDSSASLGTILHEIGHLVNSHRYLDPTGVTDAYALQQMSQANQAMELTADAYSIDAMHRLGIDPRPFLDFLSKTGTDFNHPDGLARHFYATLQYMSKAQRE